MKTLFAVFCVAAALAAPAWAAEDFTGTKELRLVHGDLGSPKAKTVVITDKAKIEKLVATIKLKKKEPCACDHVQHAIFVKDKGEITVSLCDHCFDIGTHTYVMPPEFYKLYTTYWQEASGTQPIEVFFSPKGGCTDAIIKELRNAKSSVLVQAYWFTSPSIAQALVEVHRRSVRSR